MTRFDPTPKPLPALDEKTLDRLVRGIHRPVDDPDDEDGRNACWYWHGKDGQPLRRRVYVTINGEKYLLYRVIFSVYYDDPGALTVDHTCGRGGFGCCSPHHMRAITQSENSTTGRGWAAVEKRTSVCLRGHDFTPENTFEHDGRRECRECRRMRQRAYTRGQYLRRLTPLDQDLSRLRYGSCAAGHDMADPSNVRIDVRPDGTERKACRACARDRAAKAAARRIEGW